MHKRHLQMVVSLLLGCGLSGCGGSGGSLPSTTGLPTSVSASSAAASTTSALGTGKSGSLSVAAQPSYNGPFYTSLAIDSGSTVAEGSWVPDAAYTTVGAGGTASVTNSIDTSLVADAPPASVYQTQRYAPTVTYTVPHFTPNAAYNVRLHFVESYFAAAGQRVFNIKVNGVPVLSNFDIYKSAGGANIAIAKSFPVTATGAGNITVQLVASVNSASIAGLQFTAAGAVASPTPTPTPAPTQIFAVDSGGGSTGAWVADTDYVTTGWSGATTVTNSINTSQVSSPAPQGVYQSQRWGAGMTYTLPGFSANAAYNVRLHFVESWWTGPSQRLFSVTINGTQVLTNFDIFAAAGGANVAIAKAFAVKADATGKITVGFVASVDNATVSGIEVIGAGSGIAPPPPTPTPAPTPAPSPTPGSGAVACLGVNSYPAGQYPIWSACFTGNTPVHHKYATLLANGDGNVQSQTLANNYWGQGQSGWNGERGNSGSNMYFITSGMSSRTISCESDGGGNGCGQTMYLPSNFIAQPGTTDHHIASFDVIHGNEQDIEGAASYSGDVLSYPTVYADGEYPFAGGTGICPGGNQCWSGTAGGMSLGATNLSAQEILNYANNGTHIGHALQLISGCIDDTADQGAGAGVYPDAGKNPDTACNNQNPVYGALIHLKASVSVPSLTSDPYCRAVLYAMQDYGGYTGDTSGNSSGVYAYTEGDYAYNASPWSGNPWESGPNLNADFSNNDGCFSYINNSNDIEVMYLNGNLPTQYAYGDSRN